MWILRDHTTDCIVQKHVKQYVYSYSIVSFVVNVCQYSVTAYIILWSAKFREPNSERVVTFKHNMGDLTLSQNSINRSS